MGKAATAEHRPHTMNLMEGKWQLVESRYFDEYLQALGVPSRFRKSPPLYEIKVDGDTMSIKQESVVKTHQIKFKLGEQLNETTVEGKKVISTVTQTAPNFLRHERRGTGDGKDSICVRQFLENKMLCQCTVGDVTATRW